jgi:multidrug efflux pump subunit AcrB
MVINLPNGSPIQETNQITREIEKVILDLDKVKPRLANMVSYVGGGGPRFFLSITPEDARPNSATIMINTTSDSVVDELIADIRQATSYGIAEHKISPVVGARIQIRKMLKGPPVPYPIEINVSGDNIEMLRLYSEKIQQILRDTAGSDLVHDSWGNMAYQLNVDVDEDKANLAGVSNSSVAQTLNAFFSGYFLTTYREEEHQIPVYLRLPTPQRGNLDLVNLVYVEGKSGKVPIDELATITPRWQEAQIVRLQQIRTINIRCQLLPGFLSSQIVQAVMPKIRQLESELPKGYSIEIAGEHKESKESEVYMMEAFMISIVLIVMCLVVQYNSFIKTGIVLSTVPLAFAGSFFGLYMTQAPLGFMSMLGLLSLAGIVINIGIVLIEFIEHQIQDRLKSSTPLQEGEKGFLGLRKEDFYDCVVKGTQMRITPVMLTTLTTVGGLFPLALSGDPLFTPMAMTIMFGLIFSTILALFITPVIYCCFVELFKIGLSESKPLED